MLLLLLCVSCKLSFVLFSQLTHLRVGAVVNDVTLGLLDVCFADLTVSVFLALCLFESVATCAMPVEEDALYLGSACYRRYFF